MKQIVVTLLLIIITFVAGSIQVSAESLKMTDSVQKVATATSQINVNTASIEQLMALPGIGESKAQAIVEYRESQGPFKAIDELVNVKGIGKKMMAKIADSISVK